jgi:DNA helicase HerA-like ATPase
MPLVLGSLLELFAFELFSRGPGQTYPTALVLEEAHHYLRRPEKMGEEEAGTSGLAYERLAKEGRKFGVALWLSTQRPSEVSATVLAQCGTWIAFRLSGDADVKAVIAANEWADRHEVSQIPGLPRQEALVFGSAVAVPTRIRAATAFPLPASQDPQFGRWLK